MSNGHRIHVQSRSTRVRFGGGVPFLWKVGGWLGDPKGYAGPFGTEMARKGVHLARIPVPWVVKERLDDGPSGRESRVAYDGTHRVQFQPGAAIDQSHQTVCKAAWPEIACRMGCRSLSSK